MPVLGRIAAKGGAAGDINDASRDAEVEEMRHGELAEVRRGLEVDAHRPGPGQMPFLVGRVVRHGGGRSQAAMPLTKALVVDLKLAICSEKRPKPCSTWSMSLATFSVSLRIAAMVELIESAASAVSSTAAVIIVTVCACSSIASRIRSAEVCTSSTVPWIEPLASTVWRVACWIAVILAVMSSVARAVCAARLFTSCATTAKPRPASPARAASIVALRARRLVWPAMARVRLRIASIASTGDDYAWLT